MDMQENLKKVLSFIAPFALMVAAVIVGNAVYVKIKEVIAKRSVAKISKKETETKKT